MTSTADELVEMAELYATIIRMVGAGTLAPRDVRDALQSIIEPASETSTTSELAADRFATAEDQVANVREWVRILGLLLAADQLDSAAAQAPCVEGDEPLTPLTLCWTLGSLEATIEAKLSIIRMIYGNEMVSVTREFKTDARHTKLVGGAPPFVPNRVWWQFMDLGANRFKAPNQVAPEVAAGIEVLDVICQHPIYVGQQDGADTPFLDLPGLSVRVRGASGPSTPDAIGGDSGRVLVRVRWEGSVYPDHAEPTRQAEQDTSDPG